MKRSWFLRHVVGRVWWLEPYDVGKTSPANTWSSALRNIYRRRRGLPELGPLNRTWVGDGRELAFEAAIITAAWLFIGTEAGQLAFIAIAVVPPVANGVRWFWWRVVRGERALPIIKTMGSTAHRRDWFP